MRIREKGDLIWLLGKILELGRERGDRDEREKRKKKETQHWDLKKFVEE